MIRWDLIKQYFLNWMWALDRLANVALGGSSQEFISTRIYRHKTEYLIVGWLYQILNWIDENHCELAAKRDYDPDHSKDEVIG